MEEVTGLVDSGVQMSAISVAFAKQHGLPIWQLQQLLDFEGFGRVDIPYIGYTQIQLKIPGIQGYGKGILVFIQKDSRYSERVPVVLGTLHIKDIIESATKEELRNLGEAWEMGTLGSFVLARIVQLGETPMIQQVDHYIRLTWNVTLPPMQVHETVGAAKIPVLSKHLNVIAEPLPLREAIDGVKAITGYETFKEGGNRLTTGLQNGTREKIVLRKGTIVARVTAANVVPPMLAPSLSTNENELKYMTREHKKGSVLENADKNKNKPEPTSDRLNELFSKLGLTGIQEWSDDLQQQVHNLIVEYQHLFALNDLQLGKTSKVKHEIKLSNPIPLKTDIDASHHMNLMKFIII